jgi:hypothetical protein
MKPILGMTYDSSVKKLGRFGRILFTRDSVIHFVERRGQKIGFVGSYESNNVYLFFVVENGGINHFFDSWKKANSKFQELLKR